MADVTISQLTRGTPTGGNVLAYSTGSNTLGVPVSAIFRNAGSIGVNTANTPSTLTVSGDIQLLEYGKLNFSNTASTSYINSPQSNHLALYTAGIERIRINSSGDVGIGTTNPKSTITVLGSERLIASDAASQYEQDRYFTFKKHYSTKSVSNGSYTRLIQFRPYMSGTTNYPPTNTFVTRVGVYVRIGGHSSQVGNGERCWTGSIDYVGTGVSSVITLQDLQSGSVPGLNISFSGWEAFIEIRGASGGVPGGVFGGYCYIELNFGAGEGDNGEAFVWNITENY